MNAREWEGEVRSTRRARDILKCSLCLAFGLTWNPLEARECGAPELIAPAEEAVLDNAHDDGSITWDFDWSDIPGAEQYQLRVQNVTAQNPALDEQGIQESSYHHVSKSLIVNVFRFGWMWQVRAMVDGVWCDWSQPRLFHVEGEPYPDCEPCRIIKIDPASESTCDSLAIELRAQDGTVMCLFGMTNILGQNGLMAARRTNVFSRCGLPEVNRQFSGIALSHPEVLRVIVPAQQGVPEEVELEVAKVAVVCGLRMWLQTLNCDTFDEGGDSDADDVCEVVDNCPARMNPLQQDSNRDGVGDACEEYVSFRRGDSNADGTLDIADPIANLGFQFVGSFDPPCRDALDFDDNGLIDLSDPIASLTHQFVSGPAPAPPGKDSCGTDPTEDDLTCERFAPCPAGG